MSSKSRNTPPRKERHAQPTAKAEDGTDHAEPTAEEFLEAEELLKTPKGRSPLTYAFLIFLLIFLLVVFLAADAFFAMGQQQGARDVVMRWEHPTKGVQSVNRLDFERMRRTLQVMGNRRDVEPDEVATFMVGDALATDAGVTVSDAELVESLQQIVDQAGGLPEYRRAIDRFRIPGGVAAFEETMRQVRRIDRYKALLGSMAAMPDPAEVQETWASRHELRTFDFTYTTIADQKQRALDENPDDATLQAWFDGRPDFERNQYRTQASQRVELIGAVLTDESRTFDALLAAYPDPEDVDLAVRAKQYYDSSYFARFKRPEPLDPPEDGSAGDFTTRIYFTFEEVEETCLREAQIREALLTWRAEIDADLAAGVEIDLAAEAERLGLDYTAPEGPLTQLELRELGGLGGVYIAGAMVQLAEPGEITQNVTVGAEGLAVGRLVEKLEPTMPPMAEIRDQVLESWADQRAVELATDILADVRTTLGPEPVEGDEEGVLEADYDTFVAALQTAGLPVERLSKFDRNADQATISEDEDPAQTFIRARTELYTFEEGQVSEPVKSFDNERVYMIRLDSTSEPDPASMTAKEFQQIFAQQVQFSQFFAQIDDPLSIDKLRSRYGLWLVSDDMPDPDAEGEADGADPDAES